MKIKEINDNSIKFDNDNSLSIYCNKAHMNDTLVDFKHMQVVNGLGEEYLDLLNMDFNEDLEYSISLFDEGFEIVDRDSNRLLIRCFRCQDNFCSNDLKLKYVKHLSNLTVETMINISECIAFI